MIHGKKACFKTSTSKFRYERTWILTSTSWNMPFSHGSSQFMIIDVKIQYKIHWNMSFSKLWEMLTICYFCSIRHVWFVVCQNVSIWIVKRHAYFWKWITFTWPKSRWQLGLSPRKYVTSITWKIRVYSKRLIFKVQEILYLRPLETSFEERVICLQNIMAIRS